MDIEIIPTLEKDLEVINNSNLDEVIVIAYHKSTSLLPKPEPGIKVVIILDNRIGPEVHGVVGSCVGDNIMLKVNPLVEGSWI